MNENWRGSVRARLGYAIDTFMPYLTGGVAWSDWDVDHRLTVGGVGAFDEKQLQHLRRLDDWRRRRCRAQTDEP